LSESPGHLDQPIDVLIDKRHNPGVERDLVTACRTAALQCLNQCVLGELAVLVVVIGGSAALHDPGNAVAVSVTAPRHPHSATEVLAGDLAVLPDAQRRPTRRHR